MRRTHCILDLLQISLIKSRSAYCEVAVVKSIYTSYSYAVKSDIIIITIKHIYPTICSTGSVAKRVKESFLQWQTPALQKVPRSHKYCTENFLKILHEGTLSQLWPYAFGMRKQFGGNFVQNSGKIQVVFCYRFCPQIRVKAKQKGLHRNLVVSSAGIWDLLELSATFSSKRQRRFLFFGWGLNSR